MHSKEALRKLRTVSVAAETLTISDTSEISVPIGLLRFAAKAIDESRDALKDAERYVAGAYECAFPDEVENEQVLLNIRRLLETLSPE